MVAALKACFHSQPSNIKITLKKNLCILGCTYCVIIHPIIQNEILATMKFH